MDVNVNIFEMGHKPWNYSESKIVVPLQVGAAITGNDFLPLKDNTGENIGIWNRVYAEATGIYWIWKNIAQSTDLKYIGQTTYRRPFMIDDNFNIDWNLEGKLKEVILPDKFYLDQNIFGQYKRYHGATDLQILIDVIIDNFPEYVETMFNFFNSRSLYSSNGTIMKKEDYDEYCSFLFSVIDKWKKYAGITTLADAEKYVETNFYSGKYPFWWDNIDSCKTYEMKFIGFISERLLNIYINKRYSEDKILHIPYKLDNDVF